jgi:hypothetical protein
MLDRILRLTKMERTDLQKLIEIRTNLINEFHKRHDYKSNKNAIMLESELIIVLEQTIKQLDAVLKNHVDFS